MFRNLEKKVGSLSSHQQLPSTTNGRRGGRPPGAGPLSWVKNRGPDGSARSIHVQSPVTKAWLKSSGVVKGAYYCILLFLCLLYFSIRNVRYYNNYLFLTCQHVDCVLEVQPTGRNNKVKLTLSRRQILHSMGVKTDKAGTVLIEENADLSERYYTVKSPSGATHKRMHESTYKGPDEDGNYFSYAIFFQDKQADESHETHRAELEKAVTDADLTPLRPYCVPVEKQIDGQSPDAKVCRLIVKQFRLEHTKRRIRSMMMKIESYVKRRRQTLFIKESAAPTWQGIVGIVLGVVGTVMSILVAQFYDDEMFPPTAVPPPRSKKGPQPPQKRNRPLQTQQPPKPQPPRRVQDEVLQRQTPAQYEVRTRPPSSSTTTGSTNSTSTTSSRPGSVTATTMRKRY